MVLLLMNLVIILFCEKWYHSKTIFTSWQSGKNIKAYKIDNIDNLAWISDFKNKSIFNNERAFLNLVKILVWI